MIILDRVTKFYKTAGQRRYILRDQSFHFSRGLSYALLGVNGAGKSTTMRLLAGSEMPNKGKIKRQSNISWPLGFGGGFNSELSGKENVKFVARAYGEDHRRVLDFVSDFAEIGSYINEPIKTYSSGMASRFAFGLSMAIEFECYLIDEITAVGDASFQHKCHQAFTERKQRADVIMVSHNMGTIKEYCDRALVLIDGQFVSFDDIDEGIVMYMKLNR